MKRKQIIFVLIAVLLVGCAKAPDSSNQSSEITISAASSLMESLLEIRDEYEKQNAEDTITFNFGGSGTLRRQIEQGAPIDLFFSASERNYELLVERGLVLDGTANLENNLVLIKSKHADINSFEKFLLQDGKIAIGTPEAVPAGTYAKEVLENLAVWNDLEDRMVLTKDVAQVLTYVEEGAVDIGIVYASDVIKAENIDILEEIDPKLHSSIQYYVAIIGDKNEDKLNPVEDFYQFLQNEKAAEIFKRNGFQVKSR